MTSTQNTSGRRLREAPRARGWSLLALAARARCGTTTLLACEKYGHVPLHETRARIAAALDLDPRAIWPRGRRPDGGGDDPAPSAA